MEESNFLLHLVVDETFVFTMMNLLGRLLHGKANDFAIEAIIRCFVVVGVDARLEKPPIKMLCLLPRRVQSKYTYETLSDRPSKLPHQGGQACRPGFEPVPNKMRVFHRAMQY